MKLRFRQEEFLVNLQECCMQRFRAGSILDNVEMKPSVFFGSAMTKKVFVAETLKGKMQFEEWEPGVFERIFEVL